MCRLLDLCTSREVIRLSWELVQHSRKGSVQGNRSRWEVLPLAGSVLVSWAEFPLVIVVHLLV